MHWGRPVSVHASGRKEGLELTLIVYGVSEAENGEHGDKKRSGRGILSIEKPRFDTAKRCRGGSFRQLGIKIHEWCET